MDKQGYIGALTEPAIACATHRFPRLHARISIAAVALAACASDKPGFVDKDAAATTAATSQALSLLIDNGDPVAAAAAVALVVSTGLKVVGAPPELDTGVRPDTPTLGAACNANALSGSATCDGASCTYADYRCAGALSYQRSWAFAGTLAKSADTVTIDLMWGDSPWKGQAISWTIVASLTATASNLAGELEAHGYGIGNSFSSSAVRWDLSLRFDEIHVDAQGCFTDGRVVAETSNEAVDPTYDLHGSVDLSSTCAP
jgi:hypothetical protein